MHAMERSQASCEMRTSTKSALELQLEDLTTQNRHLCEQLNSLREMYAKRTAHTELECDRLLREKDHECAEWYKKRRLKLQDMKAAAVVMYHFCGLNRKRQLDGMTSEHSKYQSRENGLQRQVEQLKAQREAEANQYKEQLESKHRKHSEELASVRWEAADCESRATRISEQLEEARDEIEKMKEQAHLRSEELDEVKARLSEVEKNAHIDRRDEQIQNLEVELQTTRRSLKERWKREAESLREELMDYVRFIVHILPDNWTETEAAAMAPTELKDKLTWIPTSGSRADHPTSSRRL